MPYKPDTEGPQVLLLGHLVAGSVLGEKGAEKGPQLVGLAPVAALAGVGQRPMAVGHLELALV